MYCDNCYSSVSPSRLLPGLIAAVALGWLLADFIRQRERERLELASNQWKLEERIWRLENPDFIEPPEESE